MAMLRDYFETIEPAQWPQVVFVTVNPERDGVAAVDECVRRFHSQIVGVTGDQQELQSLLGQLQAGAREMAGGNFDHSTALFVVAPDGQPTGAVLTYANAAVIAAEVGKIVSACADGCRRLSGRLRALALGERA